MEDLKMKKMSEVFELPVCVKHIDVGQLTEGGGYVSTFAEDETAAHAINHVDALAEALEDCAKILLKISFESSDEYQSAIAALAAYRGEA